MIDLAKYGLRAVSDNQIDGIWTKAVEEADDQLVFLMQQIGVPDARQSSFPNRLTYVNLITMITFVEVAPKLVLFLPSGGHSPPMYRYMTGFLEWDKNRHTWFLTRFSKAHIKDFRLEVVVTNTQLAKTCNVMCCWDGGDFNYQLEEAGLDFFLSCSARDVTRTD